MKVEASGYDWRDVHRFWFPPILDGASDDTLARMLSWWMAGGATPELPPFRPMVEAAQAGRLRHWCEVPAGRLSLIVVLDQFTRGLFAGTPAAYASDPEALLVAEEGLRLGHYDALRDPWEKGFSVMPLTHAEGPGHRERLERAVALSEARLAEAPDHFKRILGLALRQTRGHLDVITRFGRFPHRNPVLGRVSTGEEAAYIAKGEFVHTRLGLIE